MPLTPQLQRWETRTPPLYHQHSSYRGERHMHYHCAANTPAAQVRDMHDHCATDTPVTEVRSTCTTIVSPTTQLQRRETHALPMWHQHSSHRSERHIHYHCTTNPPVTEVRDTYTTTVPPTPQLQKWETHTLPLYHYYSSQRWVYSSF